MALLACGLLLVLATSLPLATDRGPAIASQRGARVVFGMGVFGILAGLVQVLAA